ncbi:hypothetical protein B0H13DRAFT_2470899 [Mycena leptocephala]|nr:hypothetical protein B0H13DRAFT_2470899 [Mycena leptocephala]
MHNLLLGRLSLKPYQIPPQYKKPQGVAKTQWYTQWIKQGTLRPDTAKFTRELTFIHDFMKTYEAPLWAGRLPVRVGEPAGGSLTADEYKFVVTGPWAIIIPIVWEQYKDEADEGYNDRMESYQRGGRAKGDPKPSPRMVEEEDENFLRFATALKMLIGRSIRRDQLPRIKSLLQEYLLTFERIYGADQMKPNHHWSVHDLNSNNWTGGELEVSMMREFHRNAALDSKLYQILTQTTDSEPDRESNLLRCLLEQASTQKRWGRYKTPHILPELGINTWEYQEYEDPGEAGSKPLIIPLEDVQCQVSRGTIEHTDPILWMTTTMDRFPLSLLLPTLLAADETENVVDI